MKKDLMVKVGILFYLTSILGYIYELILCFIYNGRVYNRGFLYGPWLPIYGIGALLVLSINKLKNKPWLIFILSFFITGILEYFSGLALWKFYHKRLWNYRGEFLNIGGFVCLLSATCFGIGGLFITYVIYPLIEKLVKKANTNILKIDLSILTFIFSFDLIATILK